MLPELYKNLKNGDLDTLADCVDRCKHLIAQDVKWPDSHYAGYAKVAKRYLTQYEERISELRESGETTIMEKIAQCTGNMFIPLERVPNGFGWKGKPSFN